MHELPASKNYMSAEQSKLVDLVDIIPQRARRKIGASVVHRLTPQEVTVEDGAIEVLNLLMQNGAGSYVFYNHFGKWEPILLMTELAHRSPVVRSRPILSPIGTHHDSPNIQGVSRKANVEVVPILTPDAVQYYRNHPELGFEPRSQDIHASLQTLVDRSIDTVAKGGTALIPIQGGRRDWLGEPTTSAGMFLKNAQKRGVENIALLFVGIGLDGVEDYSQEDVRDHLHVRGKHVLRFGPTLTTAEAYGRAASAGITINDFAFSMLGFNVPEAYLTPRNLEPIQE